MEQFKQLHDFVVCEGRPGSDERQHRLKADAGHDRLTRADGNGVDCASQALLH